MRSDLHPGSGLQGEFSPRHQPATGFVAALQTSVRVWHALILRETRSRFGRNALGFLWALVEPVALIALFLVLRSILLKFAVFGESAILFMAIGLIVFRYYAAIAGRTLIAISSNQALMTYPVVRPPDVIIARVLLETITMLVVTLIFWFVLVLVEEGRIIYHPATFGVGVIVTTFLAWGVGTFNAVVSHLVPTWRQIYPMLQMPLFIGSGIFYLPVTMPEDIKRILVWNPILHCVEWVRMGIYLDYLPLLDHTYPIIFGAVALTLGLGMERLFRGIILRL